MAKKKPDIQEEEESPKVPAIRKRTFRDIAKAGDLRVATGNPDDGEPIPEEEMEAEQEEEKEAEEPKKTQEEELEEHHDRSLDTPTKEEIDTKIQEGIDKAIKEREAKAPPAVDTTEVEKRKKEIEEKKSYEYSWLREKRQPKDYTEIAEETRKKVELEFEAKDMEREDREKAQKAEEQANKSKETEQQKQVREQLDKSIQEDLNDLVATEKLPAIKDEKNPDDEGVIARNNLFKAGIEVNNERIAKGLPPITSLKLIYYEHYKPEEKQPAGEDAPIVGNEAPEEETVPEVKYTEIHRKTFRQILADARKRMTGTT
jgi:hypothetical protein